MSDRGPILKKRVRHFTEWSTTQGILQAGIARRNVCLGFWLVVIAICTGMMVWQIVLVVQTYLDYDVDVQIKLRFEQRVFPSVTLCDVNAYKKVFCSFVPLHSQPFSQRHTSMNRSTS